MSQSKKRPIPSKETPKPTKRRKLRAKKQTKDGNPLKNRKIRTPDYTDSLPIDSLAWKNVTVPNRIDDFEGFFGLEEVDDVEVSRQAENSRVEFKVRRPKQATQSGIKDKVVGPNVDRKSDSVGMDHQRGEGQEEDVWEGFSDDSNDNNYKVKALGNPEKNPKASQANGKIKNGKNRSSCSDVLEDIQFTALAEENLDANEDANDNKGRAYRHNINDKVKNLSALSTKAWSPLKLSRDALAALANMRFSKPTAIQSAAIPKIMQGRDVIGKASTGSGKTLAYGIPIFEYYLKNLGKHAEQMEDGEDEESGEEEEAYSATTSTQDRPNSKSSSSSPPQHQPPITLILSPTRELAHQIRSHLLALYQPHHSPTTNTTTALSSSSSSPPPPSQHQNPSIVTVTGGLSIQKQRRLIQHAHIVVATPGRLWEVMGESEDLLARLRNVRFLVIDEADRLFSAGHFEEFEKILRVLGRGRGGRNGEGDGDGGEEEDRDKEDGRDGIGSGVERNGIDMAENGLRTMKGGPTKTQTLIFSATFSRNLQERLSSRKWQGGRMRASSSASSSDTEQSLAYLLEKLKFENKPDFIDVNPVSQMAEGLQEGIVECGATEKDLYLYYLFLQNPRKRKLVFTNSISAVRRLVPFLQALNQPANALHSHMPQKARLRSIERFSNTTSSPSAKSGASLVATDVAARGLDIPNVDLIIHYHVPRTTDVYVHRSGRTARGSNIGASILICAPEEVAGVRRLVANLYYKSSAISADSSANGANNKGTTDKAKYFLRQLDVNRKMVAQLKPRTVLAKHVADAKIAQEKGNSERSVFQEAADDLGVDISDEDFQLKGRGKGGRGSARRKAEVEARQLTRRDIQAMQAELKHLLAQRLNVGISERYITNGNLNINSLLSGNYDENILSAGQELNFGEF